MSGARFAIFLSVVLSVWALMHVYVFWRLSSIPWVAACASRRVLIIAAVALWTSYPLARFLGGSPWPAVGLPFEVLGATWIGVIFIVLSALLAVDVLTAGGWLFSRTVPVLRGGAVLVAGVLSVVALAQGLRAPVVRDYEVRVPNLPRSRDGLTLMAISDLHLGSLIGQHWLERLVRRITELRPDVVVVVGDLVDGDVRDVEALLPVLRRLRAPLGVWAVTGNHEFYAGRDRSVRLLESAGYTLLRDRWAEVIPGLVLAGVDDLTARRQFGEETPPIARALAGRPQGATILLSHTPWDVSTAASAGVNLMLCGHTHNGQIWPFNYLVRTRYALVGGRYEVGGMPVIVGHGTGTWGPRMRLWGPGEILRIRLRSS